MRWRPAVFIAFPRLPRRRMNVRAMTDRTPITPIPRIADRLKWGSRARRVWIRSDTDTPVEVDWEAVGFMILS